MSDLCRQCSAWTDDSWAICVDCRKQGYYNLRENNVMNSTRKSTPPIKCIPCRVTFRGHRYQINSDGSVRNISAWIEMETTARRRSPESYKFSEVTALVPQERWDVAREVRREASRLRRNRNARERHQALRSLGTTKTPYGWE